MLPTVKNRAIAFVVMLMAILFPVKEAAADSSIINVRLAEDPYRVILVLTEQAPYTVARIEPREVLIGLKATRAEAKIYQSSAAPLIQTVQSEQLPNNVAGINILTKRNVTGTQVQWRRNPTRLVIFIRFSEPGSGGTPPVKTGLKTRTREQPAPDKTPEQTSPPASPAQSDISAPRTDPSLAPPASPVPSYFDRAPMQKGSGTIDDIILKADQPPCTDNIQFYNAIGFCRDGNWRSAINKFDAFVKNSPQSPCVEDALFLIAYCTYKITESMEGLAGLTPLDAFQEAISRFPESDYLAYAYAGMGMTHFRLGNYVEAQGYFDIILSDFQDYRGIPQVVFENGKLHARRGDNDQAIEIFRRIIAHYPDSDLVMEAKYALGNTLFGMNHFAESLEVLKEILAADPKRIYQSPRLLQNIGNSYYHAEAYDKSRRFLSKAYNLFPESEENPTLLTRIGDSYADQGRDDKAKAIYRYVMDNHPGTNGFVLSAMRYAEYLEDKKEKQEIYNRIATGYPQNPVAKLALLRLSDLRQKAGEQEKSIESLKTLFAKQPTALEKEAYQVLGRAFLAIVNQLMQKDNYPQVIARYEAEKSFVNNAEHPELFFQIGNAYFQGRLYTAATDVYEKAYQVFSGMDKPPELMYRLGISAHESEKNSLALTMLTNYTLSKAAEKTPEKLADSHRRAGEILAAAEKYEAAIEQFQMARGQKIHATDKAMVCMEEAKARQATGDLKTGRQLLVRAINLYSSVPENQYAAITRGYTRLGAIYKKMKRYDQAVDAYTMALKFAEDDETTAEIHLWLGDLHQGAGHREKAIQAYRQAMTAGNEFLTSIAAEEIRTIELKTRMTRLPIETGA
ncbi:MAG: tetratricopeptide repeat protein [Thermodesulfobacteriota bacterium]|nr:tetratricopeptide repeat protein [Thermodesulfobacteriota bacterium]